MKRAAMIVMGVLAALSINLVGGEPGIPYQALEPGATQYDFDLDIDRGVQKGELLLGLDLEVEAGPPSIGGENPRRRDLLLTANIQKMNDVGQFEFIEMVEIGSVRYEWNEKKSFEFRRKIEADPGEYKIIYGLPDGVQRDKGVKFRIVDLTGSLGPGYDGFGAIADLTVVF